MNRSTFKTERPVGRPPSDKPLLVYDGDCNFCMHWIRKFKKATGENVTYSPSQEVGNRFAEIPAAAYESAVHWIEPNGMHLSGADAVFRLFDFMVRKRPIVDLVVQIPGFMPLARIGYHFVATHRMLFSRLTRLIDPD